MTAAEDEPAATGLSLHLVAMFAVIAAALLMTSLDQTIVATALHTLQVGLDTSISWAAWTITAYSLGLVAMLPLAGRLSDQYGRRRVFVASIAIFTIASLGCGLANDIHVLIALRAIQAIGGAGFTPSATGIIVDHFGGARDKAIGLFTSIFPIGAMIGPIAGGVIVTYWSWSWIFFINVPIGALLVIGALRLIPPDPATSLTQRKRLDLPGLGILAAALFSLMIGLTLIGDRDNAQLAAGIPLLCLAIAGGTWFVRHVQSGDDPIIPPGLLYGRGFGRINIINVAYGGGVAGLMALAPLYATIRYHIDTLGAGAVLVGQGIAIIISSVSATAVLRRTGHRGPIYLGAALAVCGFAMLAIEPIGVSPRAWLFASAAVVGLGSGWLNPASRNAGLQLAPRDAASIAALRTTGRQVGSISAISVATAIVAMSTNPGTTQALIYGVWAAAMLAILPVVGGIPEHFGRW